MLNRTTAPTTTLVTLDEVKAYLNYTGTTTDDTRLTKLLSAVSDKVERDANICFRSQTWTQTVSHFTYPFVVLRKTPITAVTVTYYDQDNAQQTLSSTNYYLKKNDLEALLFPKNLIFPVTYIRPDAVTYTLTCGMTSIPYDAQQAALELAGIFDTFREGYVQGSLTEVSMGYKNLIAGLRKGWVC